MKFIVANSGGDAGATIGASSAPSAAPKPAAAPAPKQPTTSMFPLTTPLQFKDGKYDPLQKKILEFNEQVLDNLKMTETERGYFCDAVEKLRDKGVRAEF